MTYLQDDWASLPNPELANLIEEISSAISIKSACKALARYYDSLGCELLSVKFCDREDNSRVVRPYNVYSDAIHQLSIELSKTRGCPFFAEANRRMLPFDLDEVDKSRYTSFIEKRLFKEMEKTEHKHLAVLPVMIGKGIAMANVGLYSQPFTGSLRSQICSSFPQIVSAFVNRFPETSAFFNQRILTEKEGKIIRLLCQGTSLSKIASRIGLSERTINLILENAKRKLEADNLAQLIYKSIALGEARPKRL